MSHPLSPALFLSGASAVLGMKDGTPARDASILSVLDAEVRLPAARGGALVHHAGYWSHFDQRNGVSRWPLPAPDVHDHHTTLARFAERQGILSDARPQPGEVFLLWSPARLRFVHTGIVLSVERLPRDPAAERAPWRYECHTIEGNVTAAGGVAGARLGRVRRVLSPALGDRSIKWTDFDDGGEVMARPPHRWPSRDASEANARSAWDEEDLEDVEDVEDAEYAGDAVVVS